MKTTVCKKERKREKVSSVSNPDIPLDIIEDILTRLPVKTLVRFKCVCKTWLYLFSNLKFIKAQLEKSYSYTHHRLILTPDASHFVLLNINDNNIPVRLNCPTTDFIRHVSIVGSCNGLVCVVIDEVSVFLWNPSTRISKELPLSGINSQGKRLSVYGFGYDHLNDDYKVVRMVHFSSVKGVKKVKVYSMKTNSWRKSSDFLHGTRFHGWGKYVNGVLHWKVGAIKSSMVIVSLDLGNETYGEIAQPACYGEIEVSYLSLCVLKGCLSMFCHFRESLRKNCIDIWVMKEYGVRDSWIKLHTFADTFGRTDNYPFPLCISKNGEILLKYDSHLELYNPKNRKLSRTFMGLEAITYFESLVSPNTDDLVSGPQH